MKIMMRSSGNSPLLAYSESVAAMPMTAKTKFTMLPRFQNTY
jgi:hypothetical protein